jgi:hypothetical protein
MFIDRQNIIEILQYVCFAGLILSALSVFVLRDLKKKVLSLFFVFVFITILSFIFYAGVILFIAGFIFIFVFLVLYLLASGISRNVQAGLSGKGIKVTALKAVGVIIALLFCSGLGYIIYSASDGYFPDLDGSQEAYIAGLEEISESLFTTYGIAIIIIIAAVIVIFMGTTIFFRVKQKGGEV